MVIIKSVYTVYAWIAWVLMAFWAFLWALLITLLLGKRGHALIVGGYKLFAWCWCFVVGIRIKWKGKFIRDHTPACIIVSNHGSILDMMTAPYVLPTKVAALAKKEIKKIPMVGFMFKAVSVFVDRKDSESRRKSMEEMKEHLNSGIFIFMYPEGTRNRTPHPLKEFYDGAFRMAIEIQKPILPLIFLNLRKIAPMGTFLMRPGTIYGEFLEPISTIGLTENDIPALKEKVFRIMYNYIETNDPYYRKK